jgi:hypothetical protein
MPSVAVGVVYRKGKFGRLEANLYLVDAQNSAMGPNPMVSLQTSSSTFSEEVMSDPTATIVPETSVPTILGV